MLISPSLAAIQPTVVATQRYPRRQECRPAPAIARPAPAAHRWGSTVAHDGELVAHRQVRLGLRRYPGEELARRRQRGPACRCGRPQIVQQQLRAGEFGKAAAVSRPQVAQQPVIESVDRGSPPAARRRVAGRSSPPAPDRWSCSSPTVSLVSMVYAPGPSTSRRRGRAFPAPAAAAGSPGRGSPPPGHHRRAGAIRNWAPADPTAAAGAVMSVSSIAVRTIRSRPGRVRVEPPRRRGRDRHPELGGPDMARCQADSARSVSAVAQRR